MRSTKIYAVCIAALLGLSACRQTERTEQVLTEVEAAQMEGRNAARIFLTRQWNDSTKLRQRLSEERAKAHRYDSIGKPECAAAFDSTFVSTIRTVRPELARHISD